MSAGPVSKPRILVLGGTGMLGHKLVQRLKQRGLPVTAGIRARTLPNSAAARATLGQADEIITGVDMADDVELERAVAAARPDVIVNAAGIIKQSDAANDPIASIEINSLLPHRIASLCAQRAIRLIHFSTDCVFSGRNGPYSENAVPDPVDLYGRSKLLGEPNGPRCLTLRTSIVGRELRSRAGLIEWFIAQKGGHAAGYARALYSGLTTLVLADLIGRLAVNHPELDGLWHVASAPISKYELLELVNRHYRLAIALDRDTNVAVDRRLDGGRFQARTGFSAPTWDAMIAEMSEDLTPYDA
jgi:dTDP-4-dehydrorhamnose reductase